MLSVRYERDTFDIQCRDLKWLIAPDFQRLCVKLLQLNKDRWGRIVEGMSLRFAH
jgi:hypothetical protein